MDERSLAKNWITICNIGLSTIYDLKKQNKEIFTFYLKTENLSSLGKQKTMHQSKNHGVEWVVMEWIKQKRLENFPLSRALIREQEKKCHGDLGLENNC